MEQRGRHGLTGIFSTRSQQPPFRSGLLLLVACVPSLPIPFATNHHRFLSSSEFRRPAPPKWSSAFTHASLPPPRRLCLCLTHRSRCSPAFGQVVAVKERSVSVILLSGGQGKRMGEIDGSSELVCVHDSARPLVSSKDVKKVLEDAAVHGAAVLGVPVKATIKEANSDSFVVKTLDRKTLWEMQTPQVMKPNLLRDGFELVNRDGLEVTDDVSIVEYLKHPVFITEGSYTNIKVTTPDDLLLAERLMNEK
ncbi:hypothetical protein PR202_ga08811 [Eleusine coracana subsp. coracana]|uniref:2-C-methyl-D-erythritol 4-phosphate cytidylyltransferase n=1 Tax=Eleusine coracana subsp. coracana TaxID=191504 RepID=A0AAV5C345_ELECO|nr:hypothetical protein PR202_ga08811 [Eleusine coracana subsp. coracana]